MGYKEVINNLSDFSTSRLNTISRLYNIDVETSNVNILYKAFEKIVDENLKRDETGINPSKLISHEQVVDMQYNISLAVEMYKIKYNRRTVPSHFNLFHLIQDFNILNPAQIIREVLQGKEEKKVNKKPKKIDRVEDAKNRMLQKMKMDLLK